MALKVGFCGLGNMGRAILDGIIRSGLVRAEDIVAYAPNTKALEETAGKLGISAAASEADAAAQSDVLILAVKPHIIPVVLERVRNEVTADKIVVSVAAGVTMQRLADALAPGSKLVRVMPNTPATVGEGMSALVPGANLSERDKETVMSIFRSVGRAEFVSEGVMDAVVGLSGSGPAYVYMFIEALADGAVLCGMPRALAYEFAAQTVYGSARMVMDAGRHPGELKDMVCSPGGTTIEAVKVLEEQGFRGAVINAVKASADKNGRM